MNKIASIDFSGVASQLSRYQVIGLGESTHGTREFFDAKVEIIKSLVRTHRFDTLFIESVDDHCADINAYIKDGTGDPEMLVRKLFYFYRTPAVQTLIVWLRRNYHKYPVRFAGLDERRYVMDYQDTYTISSMNSRDKRMADVVRKHLVRNPQSKVIIWAHDLHIAAYMNAPLTSKHLFRPMGSYLRRWCGNTYGNTAFLFANGTFRAATITNNTQHEKLDIHKAPALTNEYWEKYLLQEYHTPTFLSSEMLQRIAEPHVIRKQRSFGWGIDPNTAEHDGFVWIDLYHAFDSVLFFPTTHASACLRAQ